MYFFVDADCSSCAFCASKENMPGGRLKPQNAGLTKEKGSQAVASRGFFYRKSLLLTQHKKYTRIAVKMALQKHLVHTDTQKVVIAAMLVM